MDNNSYSSRIDLREIVSTSSTQSIENVIPEDSNKATDLGQIIKSPLDSRQYKSIQLPNGLKVILVSTLDVQKANLIKSNTTCHLKKIMRFNKAYLGLDTSVMKVRCECQTEAPKMMDKSTMTYSDPEHGATDVSTALMSEAMQAIRNLMMTAPSSEMITTASDLTLINDDKTLSKDLDKSREASAYLTVGAGWFNDPEDMPGLAHFCEHAVFLGSKTFPCPNQLFRLILPHDGYVNAYTGGSQTGFQVSSSIEIFAVALEMLGDMVGFPTFPKVLVTKEIEAVDSEYSLRQDDVPKYFHLLGSLAKKGHPMRKMDAGNRETLQIPNFYKKLVEWKAVHYCANYMTLTLEAPLSMFELYNMAVRYFSNIPSSKLPSPRCRIEVEGSPFDPKLFHRVYHVPSIYHSDFMVIHWALEPAAWKNLTVKPLEYLSSIISHKGEGGVFSSLNMLGWATDVIAGCWADADVTCNNYTSLFSIHIDLTEEGYLNQDYIVTALFGYLHNLIENGPSESFYRECQQQFADDFHHRSIRETGSFAESASQWLQLIPPKFVLVAPQLMSHFDPEVISKYTEMLQIETCNIMIFSQKYLFSNEKMSNLENFYKTPYASYDFPEELIKKIHNVKSGLLALFKLPKPNLYLREIVCCGNQTKNMLRNGPLIVIKGKCSLYYKDEKFQLARGQLPQAKYVFWLQSPVSHTVQGGDTLLKVLAHFMNEMIESRFATALAAHHYIHASVNHGRLQLTLTGPSNRLPQVSKDLLKIFTLFEKFLYPKSFENGKKVFIDSLDDVCLDNRWYAWDIVSYLWSNHYQLSSDRMYQAQKLEFKHFIQFVKAFKNKLYVVGQLFGFITSDQAYNVVQTLTQFIKKYPQEVKHHEIHVHRCPQFPVGENIIRVNSKNPRVHTSVVINGYQFGNLHIKEDKVVSFLAKSMSDSAFYSLRTNEQLGYIVVIYHDISYTVTSLMIELSTQPKNYSTEYCNSRIDKFLIDFYNMNLADSDKFKSFLQGKPKVEFSLAEIQSIYKSYLIPNAHYFRKVSIQIVGSLAANVPTLEGSKVMDLPDVVGVSHPLNEQEFSILNGIEGVVQDNFTKYDRKGGKINKQVEERAMGRTLNRNRKGRGNFYRLFDSINESLKVSIGSISKFPIANNSLLLACRELPNVMKEPLTYGFRTKGKPKFAPVFSRHIEDVQVFKNTLGLFANTNENEEYPDADEGNASYYSDES